MDGRAVRSVPDERATLTNLRVLYLSHNDIDEVPPFIGTLEQLELLDLRNNDLSELPEEIANLKKLRVLYISGNPMSYEEVAQIRKRLPRTDVVFLGPARFGWDGPESRSKHLSRTDQAAIYKETSGCVSGEDPGACARMASIFEKNGDEERRYRAHWVGCGRDRKDTSQAALKNCYELTGQTTCCSINQAKGMKQSLRLEVAENIFFAKYACKKGYQKSCHEMDETLEYERYMGQIFADIDRMNANFGADLFRASMSAVSGVANTYVAAQQDITAARLAARTPPVQPASSAGPSRTPTPARSASRAAAAPSKGAGGASSKGACPSSIDCFHAVVTKRGENCGKSSSMNILYMNKCNKDIRVQVCLQRSNLAWDCGSTSLKPSERSTYYICSSTGKYKAVALPGDAGLGCLSRVMKGTGSAGGTPPAADDSTPPAVVGSTPSQPSTPADEGADSSLCQQVGQCLATTNDPHRNDEGISYCRTNKIGKRDYLPSFKNTCDAPVACKLCGIRSGSIGKCVERTFSAGATVGGWGSGLVWCDVDNIRYWCVRKGADHCLKSVPR